MNLRAASSFNHILRSMTLRITPGILVFVPDRWHFVPRRTSTLWGSLAFAHLRRQAGPRVVRRGSAGQGDRVRSPKLHCLVLSIGPSLWRLHETAVCNFETRSTRGARFDRKSPRPTRVHRFPEERYGRRVRDQRAWGAVRVSGSVSEVLCAWLRPKRRPEWHSETKQFRSQTLPGSLGLRPPHRHSVAVLLVCLVPLVRVDAVAGLVPARS